MPGDFFARGGEPLRTSGADRHPGTTLGEGKRDRASNTPAATGDDRTLTGQIDVHISS